MRLIPVGTHVRLNNTASAFHGRSGILLAYVWPEMPNPAVMVRLLPEKGGPNLPCHLDELVEVTDSKRKSNQPWLSTIPTQEEP